MSLYQQLHPSNGYHAVWTGKPGQCKRSPAAETETCRFTTNGLHRDGAKCRGCQHHHCQVCRRCVRCERKKAAKGRRPR